MKNRNGYFQLSYQSDGTYLRLYPPKGKGKPVSFNELCDYLSDMNIYEYDLKALRRAFLESSKHQIEFKLMLDEIPPISETFKIKVSEDRLFVVARFYPPSTNGNLMTEEEILDILSENISYGIIKESIDLFLNNRRYCEDIVVAEGKKPIEGTNAAITYHFNTDQTMQPKLNEDGTVDFHKLDIINSVIKGDLLATLTPAVPGEPGIDVYGNTIPPKSVKNLILKHGNKIHLSEDKLRMYTDVSGHVKLENDKVCVSDTYEVETNVDASTGDITYEGNVNVKGNVITGFCICAKGDIIVNGVVEGAKLEAGGHIILKYGMQGMSKGSMKAEGNIVSKFIENAEVHAGGHITTEAILHSRVTAKKDIVVSGRKGSISGGEIRSGTGIALKNAGSAMGTYTLLEISSDHDLFEECRNLHRTIKERQAEVDKLVPVIKNFNKRLLAGESIPTEKMEYLRIATNKCIDIYTEINELVKELQKLNKERTKSIKGSITVEKMVYPGVKIVIGNVNYHVNEILGYSRFVRDKADIKVIH